jgi:hypothetical protein
VLIRSTLCLLATTSLVLAACAVQRQLPSCPTATVPPAYQPNETWEYRTAAGHTVTERVDWIDDQDTYFAWRTTASTEVTGLKATQTDNIQIASIGTTITSTRNSLPFPLRVGHAWSYDQLSYQRNGGPMRTETHRRQVITCEWVTTPAGVFRALKILDTRITPADPPLRYVAWYAPELKAVIKRHHIQGTPPPSSATDDDLELLRYIPATP